MNELMKEGILCCEHFQNNLQALNFLLNVIISSKLDFGGDFFLLKIFSSKICKNTLRITQ